MGKALGPSRLRLGLWVGPGISDALVARALLVKLASFYPKADWVVFSNRANLCFFEMDPRMSAYIPLMSLDARRPAQGRFGHWLAARAQYKKLKALGLHGTWAAGFGEAPAQYTRFAQQVCQAASAVWVHAPAQEWLQLPTPLLDAGASALAHATRLYRSVNPALQKVLCVLGRVGSLEQSHLAQLKQRMQAVQAELGQQAGIHLQTCALLEGVEAGGVLARRLAAEMGQNCQLVGLSELLGLLAYADQVRVSDPDITRICIEMGRQKQLFVG